MKVPDDYQGPKLIIIEQNPKIETPHQIVDKVIQEIDPSDLEQVTTWTKDKPDGDLTKAAFEALSKSKIVDLKDLADSFNKIKTTTEVRNQRVAASFTEWTFSRVIEEIEEIIEDKKQVKHSQI
jgi:Xaa-Pro aminopeptidase